ncbi:hypothetical protein MA16_Dca020363 [Dendrobium catenatum]|uniref:Uncharacterized protein n=1 Tax=Dendrobium catenatum TaxID=906689 RepID=A0A2I0VMU8_9ASPA|nr:hypothetical protein MA16_Dca020363 [Dendrobium catenatum]
MQGQANQPSGEGRRPEERSQPEASSPSAVASLDLQPFAGPADSASSRPTYNRRRLFPLQPVILPTTCCSSSLAANCATPDSNKSSKQQLSPLLYSSKQKKEEEGIYRRIEEEIKKSCWAGHWKRTSLNLT